MARLNARIHGPNKSQDGLPVSAGHSHVRPMRHEYPLRAAQPDVGATNRPPFVGRTSASLTTPPVVRNSRILPNLERMLAAPVSIARVSNFQLLARERITNP